MVRRMDNGTWVRQYNLTDHLGNTRAVLEPNKNIMQQTDYYPFGTAFSIANTNKNKHLYGGKKCQDEVVSGTQVAISGFEARFADFRIPRFTSLDPLAEKRFYMSPYVYCSNNPINRVDPTGMLDDEWEYIVNTNQLEKVNNKGGKETHFVTAVVYDSKGNEYRGEQHVLEGIKGEKPHVYKLRDGYIVTNYDAELDTETYNKKSDYEYSKRDFDKRNEHRKLGSVFYTGIQQNERIGGAAPIHTTEFNEYYGADADIMTIGIWMGLGMNYSGGPSFGGGKGVSARSYNGGRVGSISSSVQPMPKQPMWMQQVTNKLLKGGTLSKGDIRRIEQYIQKK